MGPSELRDEAIERNSDRWSVPAIAAALALPAELCRSEGEWERVIDRLEEAIGAAVTAAK